MIFKDNYTKIQCLKLYLFLVADSESVPRFVYHVKIKHCCLVLVFRQRFSFSKFVKLIFFSSKKGIKPPAVSKKHHRHSTNSFGDIIHLSQKIIKFKTFFQKKNSKTVAIFHSKALNNIGFFSGGLVFSLLTLSDIQTRIKATRCETLRTVTTHNAKKHSHLTYCLNVTLMFQT